MGGECLPPPTIKATVHIVKCPSAAAREVPGGSKLEHVPRFGLPAFEEERGLSTMPRPADDAALVTTHGAGAEAGRCARHRYDLSRKIGSGIRAKLDHGILSSSIETQQLRRGTPVVGGGRKCREERRQLVGTSQPRDVRHHVSQVAARVSSTPAENFPSLRR